MPMGCMSRNEYINEWMNEWILIAFNVPAIVLGIVKSKIMLLINKREVLYYAVFRCSYCLF